MFKIWFVIKDENDHAVGSGVMLREYKTKGNATKLAKKLFGPMPNVTWIVAVENPFTEG